MVRSIFPAANLTNLVLTHAGTGCMEAHLTKRICKDVPFAISCLYPAGEHSTLLVSNKREQDSAGRHCQPRRQNRYFLVLIKDG